MKTCKQTSAYPFMQMRGFWKIFQFVLREHIEMQLEKPNKKVSEW